MADWDGLRDEVERSITPPPFAALRERRRRRQQRRAIAVTCAVVLVGTAGGVAALGQHGRAARQEAGTPVVTGKPADRIALGSVVPRSGDYADYVVTDVDFVSPDTGWAIGLRCTGDRCDVATWRTGDGGRTWGPAHTVARSVARGSFADQDPAGGGARSLRMVDETNGYAFNPDLYATHDGGRTWRRLPQPTKVASVSVLGGSVWVFERGCGIDDDCDAVLRTGSVGSGRLHPAVVPKTRGAQAILRRTDATHAYLVTWDAPAGPPAALYRTADAGLTWQRGANPCVNATGIALSARAGRPLLAVCTTTVDDEKHTSAKQAYTSADAGTTWRRLPDPPAVGVVSDLVSVSESRAYLTTTQPGRLLVTDDGGQSWTPARGAATKAYGYANLDSADATHTWAMGDAGVLWRTTDGSGWERLALPPAAPHAIEERLAPADGDTELTGMSFTDADHGWVVGRRCDARTCRVLLRHTVDGGRTWYVAGAPAVSWPSARHAPRDTVEHVTFADARNGWLYGPGLFATHDAGVTWREVGYADRVVAAGGSVWAYRCTGSPCVTTIRRAPVGSDAFTGSVGGLRPRYGSFDALDATHAYLVEGGDRGARLLATSDGGKTWQAYAAPCPGRGRVLAARTVTDLWVVCSLTAGVGHEAHTIARSSDGGAHWRTTEGDELGYTDLLRPISATAAWRGDGGIAGGLRYTSDGGAHWRLAFDDDGSGGIKALVAIDATHAFAMGYSGLVYRTTDGTHWSTMRRP
jgi:photosystem II stability/assembly factor-like uncharacterized protein